MVRSWRRSASCMGEASHGGPSKMLLSTELILWTCSFVEHIERYNHAFEKFASEGLAVFAFDQRGMELDAADFPGRS